MNGFLFLVVANVTVFFFFDAAEDINGRPLKASLRYGIQGLSFLLLWAMVAATYDW